MGFSFADFGLVSTGANRAFAAEDARRRAEEDRAYLTQERQRRQELEQAALEDARRQREYEQSVRDLIPQYLAGGASGVPAQPAQPGVELDPRQQEGGDLPITATPAQPAQDNLSGLYQALAANAAKYGRMKDFDAMKGRLDRYQQEGVLDFIAKARQGAPENELIDTFNRSGKVKLAALRKTDEGTYAAVTTDGKPVELNLDRMTESLLGPKDYVAHADRAEKTQATLDARKATLDARSGVLAAQEDAARARAERDRSRAEGGQAPRTSGNWNQFDSQVRQHANGYATGYDENSGRDKVDRKLALQISSMASAMARRDPSLSPAEAVEAAATKIDEARQLSEQNRAQAEREASGLSFANPKKRDAWVKSRTEGLERVRADEGTGAKATPARAAAPAGSGYRTADGKVIPEGTRVRNKKTGQTMVVRNGELVAE